MDQTAQRELRDLIFGATADGAPRFSREEKDRLLVSLTLGLIAAGKADEVNKTAMERTAAFLADHGVRMDAPAEEIMQKLEHVLKDQPAPQKLCAAAIAIVSSDLGRREQQRAEQAHKRMSGDASMGNFVESQKTGAPDGTAKASPLLRFNAKLPSET